MRRPPILLFTDLRPVPQPERISFWQWLWLAYYVIGLAGFTVFCGWLIGGLL